MKLLFITNLYPPHSIGGYEEVCHDIAEGLKQRGHTVVILTSCFRASALEAGNDVYRHLKTASGGPAGFASGAWTARTTLGLEWHNTLTVRRMLAGVEPDHVLVWNGGMLGRLWMSALDSSTRTTYYLADTWLARSLGNGRHSSRPSLRTRASQAVLSRVGFHPAHCNRLVFCSEALVRDYQRLGIEVEQPTVIRHGVALDRFPPQQPHLLRRKCSDPYRILYSGRIVPEKGIVTLLKALARVRIVDGLRNTRLSLVGPPPGVRFAEELRGLTSNLALDGAVDFLQHHPRHELPKLYAAHDVLAFPAEWSEPFSVTLLEAMASGLPIVSTMRGGSSEILRHGANAVTFGAGDADELAQALIWTLTHPDLVADIARVARTEVAQRYQLDSQIRSLEAYLQNSTGSATGAEQVAGSSVRKRTGTEGSVDDRIQIPSYKPDAPTVERQRLAIPDRRRVRAARQARRVIVSKFSPSHDGIAKYADQLAASASQGATVVRLGLPGSDGDVVRRLDGALRPLRMLRVARAGDEILLMWNPWYYISGRVWHRTAAYFALGLVFRVRKTRIFVHEPIGAVAVRPRLIRGLLDRFERTVQQWCWSSPAEVVFHTAWEREEFGRRLGRKLPPDRTRLENPGAYYRPYTRGSRDQARQRLGLHRDALLFVCLGFLARHKGQDRAVRALSRVEHGSAELHVVGSALYDAPDIVDYIEELRQLVRSVRGAFLVERFIDDQEFDLWIRAADAVLVPYRSSVSSSAVVARARLLGTRVLASPVGGIPEQLGAKDLVVASDDALASALMDMAKHHDVSPGERLEEARARS